MGPIVWHCGEYVFRITRKPLILGIVNVTPDSFSDGGRFFDPIAAVDHGLKLAGDGADILDVGGESTRPGSSPVSTEEEIRRVVPVVRELVRRGPIPVSVDTSKAAVARAVIDEGASVINDVTGLRGDPGMAHVIERTGAGLIVMHMRGTPSTMQLSPTYSNIVDEVGTFFRDRLATAVDRGIDPMSVAFDPGIGFGKTTKHNLEVIACLAKLGEIGRPICLGVSRKRFIGELTMRHAEERMAGSLAIGCFTAAWRTAHILRVHDVAQTRDGIVLLDAIDRQRHQREN